MIMKYKPQEKYRHLYDNKKVIYCKVEQKTNTIPVCYKVRMINLNNFPDIITEEEGLEKLNILDKIKLLFIKEK